MTVPGKLTVGADGRLHGPASIGYATPFPVPNGTPGGSAAMRGVVMHTEVGYDPTVVTMFEAKGGHASAWFSVRDDGHITQYGPVGKGWMAWAQMAGNPEWYSIEHEDKGHPEVPLTHAQMVSSAQLVECLSAFAGFPLQATDSVAGHGYGVHYMGGAAWGGHSCPDVPPHPVRSLQRAPILMLAKEIRAGVPHLPPLPSGHYTADGHTTLAGLAQRQGCDVRDIWFETTRVMVKVTDATGYGHLQGDYMDAGKWDALMPAGMVLWLP